MRESGTPGPVGGAGGFRASAGGGREVAGELKGAEDGDDDKEAAGGKKEVLTGDARDVFRGDVKVGRGGREETGGAGGVRLFVLMFGGLVIAAVVVGVVVVS